MKNYKYIGLFLLSLGIISCENNDFEPIEAAVMPTVALDANGLNLSKYVAVGASFTAGYTDGALFKAAQENSFPNILASKFSMADGGEFNQPLMEDNTGGFVAGGNAVQPPRLYFNGVGPTRLNALPTTTLGARAAGTSFNNYGIPGAKSFHLTFAGYATLNPYFERMASSENASVVGDATAQQPTFFTLSEVGGNDVLGFATSGGDGSDMITPPSVFNDSFTKLVIGLTKNNAKGVISTVPNITLLPFFNTVPNDALELDAATADSLTGFFQAVSGIFIQGAIGQGVPPAQAQALGAQYALTFTEGKNRWVIDVPVTQTNPLGFRQMTEDELLVLTIDQRALAQGYGSVLLTPAVLQVLGKLQAGAQITPQEGGMVLAAVNGIDDKDALDIDELASIKSATDEYNKTIKAIANSNNNIALVDLNAILLEASGGIRFDNYTMTTSLVTGGLVSLDGIHLTGRGYALMANKILEAMDAKFGSNFTTATNGLAKADDYPTNFSPTLR